MAPGVSSCHFREVPPSISFSGSGFMATYQLGVAQCFLNYAPWILRTAPCVLGASAGSLVAAAVVCEMSMVTIRDEMLHFAKHMKGFTLGPLNPSVNIFQWLEVILQKHLPSDAHRLAHGRLAVAVTRLSDSETIIMSEFQSKEDVVQALLCSCFVPGYCGMLPPSIKGIHYVDGGFSTMQPLLPAECSQILTVSPFSGEMDICPADTLSTWDMVVSGTTLKGNMANSLRIINALYPMTLQALEQAYDSGYKDAFHFLLSNNLGPHWLTHNVFRGPPNPDQTQTWMHPKSNMEKKEEMMVEKKPVMSTSPMENRCKQTDSDTEPKSTGTRQVKEPPFQFEILKNVLLANVVIYLSMLGLPAIILSHLLLPVMLSIHAVLHSSRRLEMLSRQVLEFVFWAWQGLRHFTIFFYNIVVCSLKKNIENRIVPIIIALQWLKVLAQYERPPVHRHASPDQRFPFSAHSEDWKRWSLHRWFLTSQDIKKPKLQYL